MDPIAEEIPVVTFESESEETDAAKEEAPIAALPPLPVLAVPTERSYVRFSGMVQCSIAVEKNKFVMYYQHPDGSETPVLMARKQKTLQVLPKYHVFDISEVEGGEHLDFKKSDHIYLGKFRRDKNLRIHGFSLTSEREEGPIARQVMYALCTLPSVTNIVLRREPSRSAQVAIYNESDDSGDQGNTLAEVVSSSLKETSFLDRVCDPDSGLYAFSNKEPFKTNSGELALNFFSRCRGTSHANMQIEDENGRVLMQIAKWDGPKYNVDFR